MRRLLACCLLLAGCGNGGGADATRSSPPPDQVTGVITELQFDGDQLTRFDVEAFDGTYEIFIDPERDYGFNLGHLRSHKSGQLPVLVHLEARDGDLYALDILDA
ncbi:MAG: hypothetical protein ACRDH9_09470 [Actinomycetota bacterium]